MRRTTRLLIAICACVGPWAVGPAGQTPAPGQGAGVDAAMLLKPLGDNWPSYSGDYSGKRYSSLTQVNQGNVKNLQLVWSTRIQPGLPAAAGGRGGGFGGGPVVPTIIGGEGTGELNDSGGRSLESLAAC